MRKATLLLVLLVLVSSVTYAADREPVFQEWAWGDPLEAIEGYTEESTGPMSGNATLWNTFFGSMLMLTGDYTRHPDHYKDITERLKVYITNDIQNLGSLPVSWVKYAFFDDQLVAIVFNSREGGKLQDILVTKYGPGRGHPYAGMTWVTEDTELFFQKMTTLYTTGTVYLFSTKAIAECKGLLEDRHEQVSKQYQKQLENDAKTW